MSEFHRAFLSLGSNIEPEANLARAVERLQQHGRVERLSSAWQSESVGAAGPDYLNACALLATPLPEIELKTAVLLPIERDLGRERNGDRFAPRTMDIDIVVFDGLSCDGRFWDQAFVVIPLAEIHPHFTNPLTGEALAETALRLHSGLRMERRPDVLERFQDGETGP